MKAQLLQIEDKVKMSELGHARLNQFRYRPDSVVDARIILERPEISLYCLEDDQRQAVFVETPAGVDISDKPYFFLTQYQNAQRLLTVNYDVLHGLAEKMGDRFKTLIPMYSVGRTGGTLVSRAMNRLGTVLSLDEPDVHNDIVIIRPEDGSRDAELTRLVQSCTRLLFKPIRPGADTLFLKFRPFSIEIGDLIHKAFPTAKAMFIYRNAESWARSVNRSIESLVETAGDQQGDPTVDFLKMLNLSRSTRENGQAAKTSAGSPRKGENVERLARLMPLLPAYIKRNVRNEMTLPDISKVLLLAIGQQLPFVKHHCRTPTEFVEPYIRKIPPIKLLALPWLSTMHKYLSLHAQGIPMMAVRYETLVASPLPALRAVFEYCGLPVEAAEIAEEAFAEDSQKGTPLSRDRVAHGSRTELAPELLAQLREVIHEHPPVDRPDFVVPNTLSIP
jgi:hypothetical protein